MLKSLGEFSPYGRRHTQCYPHLVDDASETQEVDFDLFKGGNAAVRQRMPYYSLYAVDGRPLTHIDEHSGDIIEQTPFSAKRKLPNGAIELEEELYVDGSTVIWSRGGHIVKSLKYELEKQPVELALFAWFRFSVSVEQGVQKYVAVGRWPEDTGRSDRPSSSDEPQAHAFPGPAFSIASAGRKRKQADVAYESSKRPARMAADDSSSTVLRKALCVILRDSVKIYFQDGLMYSVHLHFPVQRAYALHVGLLLERKRADMIDDSNAAFLQPFICITDPMGECELVAMADDPNRSFSLDLRKDISVPVDHELAFATAVEYSRGDKDKQQLVVTYNTKRNAHSVWVLSDEKERLKQPPKMMRKPPQQPSASFHAPLKSHKKTKGKGVKQGNMPSPIATTPPPLTRKDSLAQFHEDFSSDTDQLFGSEAGDSFHESDNGGHFLHLLYETSPAKADKRKHARDVVFLAHDGDGSDLLCIMRNREQVLLVLSVGKMLAREMDVLVRKIHARSAVPITSTNGAKQILILRTSTRIQLVVDARNEILANVILPPTFSEKIRELNDSVSANLNVHLADGRVERCRAELVPGSGIVQDSMAAIAAAVSGLMHALLCKRYIEHCFATLSTTTSARRSECEWRSFIVTLLSFLPLETDTMAALAAPLLESAHSVATPLYDSALRLRESHSNENITIDLDTVLQSLHMQYEDYRLSQLKRQSLLPKLAPLVSFLAAFSGNADWLLYYTKHTPIPCSKVLDAMEKIKGPARLSPPPDIIGTMRYFSPTTTHRSSPEDIFGIPRIDPILGLRWNAFGHTIDMAWLLHRVLRTGGYEKMVDRMVKEGIRRYEIEDLDPIIGEPLVAALNYLQEQPPMAWTWEHYILIGRQDMVNQLREARQVVDPNAEQLRLGIVQPDRKDMHELCMDESAASSSKLSSTHGGDALDSATEKLRFGYEGVLEVVRTALDGTRTPELTVPDRPDLSDADITAEHQTHVVNLVQRTIALSVGRGIYALGTYTPDLTKDFPVESMNLSAKLLPLRTVVTADDRHWSQDYLNWPRFHNGVAAGLRISPSSRVGGSWIDFCNREEELRPEHGGFLLASGLNGNLKELPLISWYRYMTQTCELATAGFVLGLAAAYRGTKNTKVTKLLAVHVPALLPPDSTALNHSILIQSTCLVSLGLVFMGSCDRLMSSVMVAEIERYATANPSTMDTNFESCALAAGFSLGFITLGCGDETAGLFDLHLKDKLCRLMMGQTAATTTTTATRTHAVASSANAPIYQDGSAGAAATAAATLTAADARLSEPAVKPINLDVTSPGATIALGLMYLQTNNARVADRIDILVTRPYLNYIRPDLLMLRIVARNLIMWDGIQPTDAWVDSHVPGFIKHDIDQWQKSPGAQRSAQAIEASKQAMYNIVGGACLCIGLRFAGSNNQQAFECLLSRLDDLVRLSNMAVAGFQENITRSVVRTCVDVVATAAAMVVAGTGNLALLDRLKALHDRVGSHTKYGNHMASHMAMGLLFAGLGGYTLKTSKEAIAGLLCAFYPFYPTAPDDNRYCLQAFRHLWTLALDVRWLMPFDVDTGKPCRVPLMVTVRQDEPWLPERKQQEREIRLSAPTVLPNYSLIKTIKLDSSRYYPLCLRLDGGNYQKAVTTSGVLYVQRRPGCEIHDECHADSHIPTDGLSSLSLD